MRLRSRVSIEYTASLSRPLSEEWGKMHLYAQRAESFAAVQVGTTSSVVLLVSVLHKSKKRKKRRVPLNCESVLSGLFIMTIQFLANCFF